VNWESRDDQKSVGGFTFLLNGAAISWNSKKQSTVALSSTEAQYLALTQATKESIWLQVEFVTGRTGPRKTQAPGPFPRTAPLNGLGLGVFFGIPCPCPHSGPRPTHTPEGSPLKIGGNKQGPVQGISAGGPLTGAGRGSPGPM